MPHRDLGSPGADAGRGADDVRPDSGAAEHRTRRPARPAHGGRHRQPRTSFLPFNVPDVGEAEAEELVLALRSGWLTTGPRARAFEEAFAEFVARRSYAAETTGGDVAALALNACSAGLHTALHVLGVGPGDAVITTPHTFAATSHAIDHVGAEIVFADVEQATLGLSAAAAADAVARARARGLRPAALLPVHFAGHPVDIAAFEDIAAAEGLALVEDAAHAFPARAAIGTAAARTIGAPSRKVPSLVAFSFYANKTLTTGDGGMLTGAPELIDAARAFCRHGIAGDNGWRRDPRAGAWQYDVVEAGFKYGMTDLAAAVGLVQLRRADEMHARRRAIAARYAKGLSRAVALGLELPAELPGYEHAWHLYVVRLPLLALRIGRNEFVAELAARKVGASVHYRPLPDHPHFRAKGHDLADYPVTAAEWLRLVSLPMHSALTDDDIDDVCEAVTETLEAFRR